jgi:putative spermidine/putrescine transport system ATP-binding protein
VADRVGVMRAGRLEQLGTPAEVYLRRPPRSWPTSSASATACRGLDGDGVVVLGTRLPLVSPAAQGPEVTALVRRSPSCAARPRRPGRC